MAKYIPFTPVGELNQEDPTGRPPYKMTSQTETQGTVPSLFFSNLGVRSRGLDQGTQIAAKSAMTELRNTARELSAGGYDDELNAALEGGKGVLDLGSGFTNELFDFLQIGQFTLAGSASELLASGSPAGALRRAAVEFSHALPGDTLSGAALSLTGALDPQKTIAEIKSMPVMEASWADVMSGRGLTDERKEALAGRDDAGSRMATASMAFSEDHPTIIAATGFALDVLLDPTTYLGFGVTKAVRGLSAFDGMVGRALPGTQESISQFIKQSERGSKFRKMFIPKSLEQGLADGENAFPMAEALNNVYGFKSGDAGFIDAQDVQDWAAKYLHKVSTLGRSQREQNAALVDTIYNIAGSLPQDQLIIMHMLGDQPKAFDSILPKLGLDKAAQDNMKDRLKQLHDVYDTFFDKEVNNGILSAGQHRSHYMFAALTEDPKMQQIVVSSMKSRYGAEVGEMVAKRIKDQGKIITYGKGDGIVPKKATFQYVSTYANMMQRLMAGVPVELNAGVAATMRGFEHVQRMTTENLYKAVLSDNKVVMPLDDAIADAAKGIMGASDDARNQLKMIQDAGMDVLELKMPGVHEKAAYAIPRAMKEAFEKGNKVFTNPDEAQQMFQTFKNLTSVWKGYALMSPGFHIRNIMSGVFNNWVADMNISDPDTLLSYKEGLMLTFRHTRNMPPAMRSMMETAFGGEKALKDMKFKWGDEILDGEQVARELEIAGVSGGGQIATEGAGEAFASRQLQRDIGRDFAGDGGRTIKIDGGLEGWGDATERVGKVSGQFKEMFKKAGATELADDEYTAMAELYDTVAKAWAFKNNRTPNDWWSEKIAFSDAFKSRKLKSVREAAKGGNPVVVASRTPGKKKGSSGAGVVTFEDGNEAAVDMLQKGKAFVRLSEKATPETMVQSLGTIVRRLMLDVGDQNTLSRWATSKETVSAAMNKAAKEAGVPVDALSDGQKMVALEAIWTPKVEAKFNKSFAHFLGRGTEGLNINNAMQGTFDRIRQSLDGILHFTDGEHGAAKFGRGGQAWRKVRTLLGEGVDEAPEDLTTLKAVMGGIDEAETVKGTLGRLGGIADNRVLDANREIGRTMEYFLRSSHYIFKRRKGFTAEAADTSVKTYHFDYNELTDFERKYMKMVIPFYTWMRKNIPLQLTELMKQPERYAKIPKTMDAIENLTPELDNLPTPDYYDEVNAIRLPWDAGAVDEDADGLPMYLIPDLPYQDLGRVNLRDWLSSLNPALKAPIELLGPKGYSIFLDRPIEKFPGEPAFAGSLLGEDMSLSKKALALAETAIPPLGKYVTRPIKAYRDGKLTEELMRTLLATGTRSSDPDRNAVSNIFKKRAAVRLAKQKIKAKMRLREE